MFVCSVVEAAVELSRDLHTSSGFQTCCSQFPGLLLLVLLIVFLVEVAVRLSCDLHSSGSFQACCW